MTCVHLRKLYQLCHDNNIKLSGADLIHIICEECGVKEVCPSMLNEQYEEREAAPSPTSTIPPAAPPKA